MKEVTSKDLWETVNADLENCDFGSSTWSQGHFLCTASGPVFQLLAGCCPLASIAPPSLCPHLGDRPGALPGARVPGPLPAPAPSLRVTP